MGGKWTGLVLAGGESRRMGRPKLFLPREGSTLVEQLADRLSPYVDQVVIVTRLEFVDRVRHLLSERRRVTVVPDALPHAGKGPLAGIYTGMNTSDADFYVVAAVDMPFLDESFFHRIRLVAERHPAHDAWVPLDGERVQPLSAVYRPSAKAIARLLDNRCYSVRRFLRERNTREITEREWKEWFPEDDGFARYFVNWNTPDDARTSGKPGRKSDR